MTLSKMEEIKTRQSKNKKKKTMESVTTAPAEHSFQYLHDTWTELQLQQALIVLIQEATTIQQM